MGETHDPLRLGVKRAKGCTQLFRQLARGEIAFKDLDSDLRTSSGCRGRGCYQCAEAALRLVYFTAWATRPVSALKIARWVDRYVDHMGVDFRLRARTVIAALLRPSDIDSATTRLAATYSFRDTASVAERAHHYALAATILTDAYRIGEGRKAVIRSRELYRRSCPADPERGSAWAAIADTFVETGAPHADFEPQLESVNRALEVLKDLDEAQAPITFQALSVNVLAVIVSAWRFGIEGIDPYAVLKQIEESFDFRSRRSDPAATTMRWLWVVVASKIEGLSQTIRNRLRHARSGLIAQRRWQDLLYLELDVLWAACYYHRHQPLRSHLLSQAEKLQRALSEVGHDLGPLADFQRAAATGRCQDSCRKSL